MEHRLKVIGPDQVARELRLEADSQMHAMRLAAASGVQVLSFVEEAAPTPAARTTRFDLLLFTQELVALLEAGLHVNAALRALAAKASQQDTRALLDKVVHDLSEGKPLSESLANYPALFPHIYVSAVRANEKSGGLAIALARYAHYYQQIDQLKRKVISASIYPALLLGVGACVTLFLIGYVVPKFSAVYDTAGRDVPMLSRALIAMGSWIHAHLAVFASTVAALIAVLAGAWMQPSMRQRLAQTVTRTPWLQARARDYRLGRLYRTLGLLLQSGITLTHATQMAGESLVGKERDALNHVRRALEEGHPLSDALKREGLSTSIADSLIRVGENSGNLGAMLERTAQFHDDSFARWLDVATRLIEPLLMITIGLIIGAVVVLMYLPIFDLAASLG